MMLVFGRGVRVGSRAIVLLAGWCLFLLAICWWEGSLRLEGEHVGLLGDTFMLGLVLVSVVMIVMTVRLTRTIDHVCDQLPRLLKRPAQTHEQLANDIQSVQQFIGLAAPSGRRYYHGLLLGMLVLVGVFQVLLPLMFPQEVLSWSIWPAKYPLSFAAGIPWAIFWTVLVFGNVIWISTSSTFQIVGLVNRYARRDELATVPLAPDGCGGTSCIGQLALANTLLAGCGMIQVIIWLVVFRINAALVLGFGLYVLFLAAIFVVPSLGIHQVMVAAKERELERLSAIAQRYHSSLPPQEEFLTSEADAEWWQDVGTKVQFQSDLERLYERAREMPEWPFDSLTVGRFFTLVVVPVLLFVIQALAQEPLAKLASGIFR